MGHLGFFGHCDRSPHHRVPVSELPWLNLSIENVPGVYWPDRDLERAMGCVSLWMSDIVSAYSNVKSDDSVDNLFLAVWSLIIEDCLLTQAWGRRMLGYLPTASLAIGPTPCNESRAREMHTKSVAVPRHWPKPRPFTTVVTSIQVKSTEEPMQDSSHRRIEGAWRNGYWRECPRMCQREGSRRKVARGHAWGSGRGGSRGVLR